MGRQRLEALGQRRVARLALAARPAPGRIAADRRFQIVAERRRQSPLIARLGAHFGQRRAAALRQRLAQRLALGGRGGQRRPCRSQLALMGVAGLGGLGPALLGRDQRRLGLGQGLFGSGSGALRFVLGRDVPGAIAERLDLPGQPRHVRFGPLGLRASRFQRRLGNPPFGAHRRLARQQRGQIRFGLPRRGFRRRQLGGDPRRLRLAVGQPRLDRLPLRAERIDRLGGVLAQRFLAGRLGAQGFLQAVELGEAADHGVAAGPRRRQLMRQGPRPVAGLGQRRAPRREVGRRMLLRQLRVLHRLLQRADRCCGEFRLFGGGGGGHVGLVPAGIKQARFGGADLVAQLPVALGRARLPPQGRGPRLLVAEQLVQPGEIGFGGAQFLLGVLAPRVQAGNAGRLFQHQPPFDRLGGDHRADPPLADQGRGMGAGGGVGEQQGRHPSGGRRGRRSGRRSPPRARSGA